MIDRSRIDCTPEIEQWRKENPIRLWLDRQPKLKRKRMRRLRQELGLGREAIYRYMHGHNLPSPERLVTLLSLIRCSLTTYMAWWRAMPQP